MTEDIVPELLERIEKAFSAKMAADPELQAALKAVKDGSTSYTDALNYADRVGQMLKAALQEELTPDVLPDDTLYYNITQRLVNQVFGEAYDLGEAAAVQVQEAINQAHGLGLSAVTSKDQKAEELDTMIETVSGKKIDETDGKKLFTAAEKVSLNGASDTMEANADFQGGAGLKPKIYRKASFGCCPWCSAMSGTYDYPNVPHDVYRRHENCRCTVEYDPGTGQRQNVHTKQWSREQAAEQRQRVQQNLQNAELQQQEKSATIKQEREQVLQAQAQKEFPSKALLDGHFKKHQQEYGAISEKRYLQIANEVASESLSDDVVQLERSDGSISKYRYSTNDFLVINKDGTIRTLFKPVDKEAYWKDELDRN